MWWVYPVRGVRSRSGGFVRTADVFLIPDSKPNGRNAVSAGGCWVIGDSSDAAVEPGYGAGWLARLCPVAAGYPPPVAAPTSTQPNSTRKRGVAGATLCVVARRLGTGANCRIRQPRDVFKTNTATLKWEMLPPPSGFSLSPPLQQHLHISFPIPASERASE